MDELAEKLHITHLLRRRCHGLSTGERQRVSLARASIHSPPILVLDEPTAGQDGRFKETLVHICGSISEMGTAVVVVTHDLDFARASADRWVVMHAGRIAADGAPEEMRAKHLSILENATDRPPRSVAGCV